MLDQDQKIGGANEKQESSRMRNEFDEFEVVIILHNQARELESKAWLLRIMADEVASNLERERREEHVQKSS